MGDELGFDEFYAASFRRLVGQLYAMTGSLADSEDAVQEAYARAWQRWDKVREYGAPEAWIRTVAYRIAVSAGRKAKNRLLAHGRHGEGRGFSPGLSPDHLALMSALRRISADQRRVIVLHYLVGLSVDEIADETASPAGTVKAWLSRGRKAMAPYVSEFADTAPGTLQTKTILRTEAGEE
ncbi:SigE family RNA polymerase sigma factor [Actinocrinis puniceicyclus]|uniref:SigE family RNA polymerase sigma factor n=1 Tax=Actinocrinis puniceicyclus TaxID=977794 RepID=A0A8J7WQU8_9ACTN|nr:SigE family RNA polymerase sigma factor [Actinocrinis puniceicyclus]MBS2965045.1 SigE family RNA polymerase sigma factor [Actinocrinis puniceicyclus]